MGNYSLGMRQRLGIAAALIGDPSVLILDEPANGLDPAGIRWMRDLLRDYADHGGTVLLSSHLLAEIEIIADDIVMIGQGRIVCQGSKSDLLQAAGTVVRAADVVALQRALAAAGFAATVSEDGSLRTDADHRAGRTSGVRRRRGAHRAPHRRQWRTRGDVPRAHRRHPTRHSTRKVSGMTATTATNTGQVTTRSTYRVRRPSRSAGSSASSSARCSTPARGSG